MNGFFHVPVLCAEAVAWLQPQAAGVYLDGTFGGGGYAAAILAAASCTLWAIDRDPAALARGAVLAAAHPERLHLIEGRIGRLFELLSAAGLKSLNGAVFDLGVSSYQIDDAERGFSFRKDGPLDMRMGNAGRSAAEIVNTSPESELADILYAFGEEKASRRIAAAIVERRSLKAFATTLDLAGVIRSVVRPDRSGIDPATRSFQALRIAVNDELTEVTAGLQQAAALIAPGGRLVVVSFHSLEDRIVKRFMAGAAGRSAGASRFDPASAQGAAAPLFRLLTARPVVAGAAELRANPRARSAKLRAMERLAA